MNDQANEHERRTEELIARAVDGDREAIATLYRIYEAAMIDAAHRRRGRTLDGLMESVDLVQSVWGDVLEDLEDYRPRGPGSFEAWLQTCLLNKIRAKGRHHAAARRDAHKLRSLQPGASEGVPHSAPPASDPTPSRIVVAREEVERLMKVLEGFPEEQRRVLIMRMRDDLPYAEIADRVGKSVEATKKLHGRGLRKLAEVLSRHDAS